MKLVALSGFGLLLAAGCLSLQDEQRSSGGDVEPRVIDAKMWHLGDDATPEWPEASEAPEGTRLDLVFEGRAVEGEGVLLVEQRHVSNVWTIELNGRDIGRLENVEELVERFYVIPPGVLRDGRNELSFHPDVPTDDITLGNVRYYDVSLREAFDLRPVRIEVADLETGAPLPARVTLVGTDGELARLHYGERALTAVRPGVIYTSDGVATFEVAAGEYEAYAVRGTEWSLARASLVVGDDGASASLGLRRELDTTGFVAADTHVHTLTHSGHGDSSVEERMVTLAGEGVELAIATDHNHNTDYRPTQSALGLGAYFTPVVGNEISTPIGHFNAFPLDPNDELPLHTGNDVVAIVADARAKGAEAVILNHPRWPDHETGPHGVMRLDLYSGDWRGDWQAVYDAMELINSQTEEAEPMLLFRDWFALLNRGEHVMAAASSDSHTVGGVVGQGRTYVLSATDDPARLDVDACARNVAEGRSSISMGIFVDARRDGRSILGETIAAGATSGVLDGVELRVAAPSWIHPRRVELYANGVLLRTMQLDATDGETLDATLPVDDGGLALPKHDFWLVAVVHGDGVGGAWWPQVNPYTLAATNPIFVDVDGDGSFRCPRELARREVEQHGVADDALAAILTRVDSATAVQVLRLARLERVRAAEASVLELGERSTAGDALVRGWIDGLAPSSSGEEPVGADAD